MSNIVSPTDKTHPGNSGEQSAAAGLQELAARALSRQAERPAVEFEERWFSWGELCSVADCLGSLILSSELPAHGPVAFIPRNRPWAIAALLGLIAKGCTVRMIYSFQSAAGIARDVRKLKPAIIVAGAEDYSEELLAVLHEESIAAIAIRDMDAAWMPGLQPTARVANTEAPADARIEILTSGTTGPPKHFAVPYELIARHFVQTNLLYANGEQDPLHLPPALLYFPLGNISGIYSTLPPLVRGQRVVLLDRFNIPDWHSFVRRFRPEIGSVPPAALQAVVDANIPSADLSSIKYLFTGAAPLDPNTQRAFEERYGIPVLLSYGATEFAGPVAAMTPQLYAQWGKQKFGSVGRAMEGAQLRVVDPETETIASPDKEGILEVISPRLESKWIRTADICVIDSDGFVFHRGRADGAIVRGGFKLLPETIERALLLHDAVAATAVVGIADKRVGQVPAAVIQLKAAVAPPTVAELEAHLRNHVPANHVPVAWRFVEELPKNASVKIDRPALKQMFERDRSG